MLFEISLIAALTLKTYNFVVLNNLPYAPQTYIYKLALLNLYYPFSMQKATRIISKRNFRAHTEPLFKEHNLLNLKDIIPYSKNFYSK